MNRRKFLKLSGATATTFVVPASAVSGASEPKEVVVPEACECEPTTKYTDCCYPIGPCECHIK